MLIPRDARYKQRESDAHQMHIALGEWTLAKLRRNTDEITKREDFVGNCQYESFVFCGGGEEVEYAEFNITTEYFYGRREVYYSSSDTTVMYHYTIEN